MSTWGQGHCLTFVKGHLYFETSVPTLPYKYMLGLRWAILALLGNLFPSTISMTKVPALCHFHMRLIRRKPVFGVCDQVRFKTACSVIEISYSLEILALASIGTILSKQRKTEVLIRLHWCAGWSAPLLFTYGINRFSHDMAHMLEKPSFCSERVAVKDCC